MLLVQQMWTAVKSGCGTAVRWVWHCCQGWVWLHLQWLKSTEKVEQQMKEAQAEESSEKKRKVVRG